MDSAWLSSSYIAVGSREPFASAASRVVLFVLGCSLLDSRPNPGSDLGPRREPCGVDTSLETAKRQLSLSEAVLLGFVD